MNAQFYNTKTQNNSRMLNHHTMFSLRSLLTPLLEALPSSSRTLATTTSPRIKLNFDFSAYQNKPRPSGRTASKSIPQPRNGIDTPEAFLKAIGRGCEQFSTKFTDWDRLFTATSAEMESLGIPVRARKYILSWREQYR